MGQSSSRHRRPQEAPEQDQTAVANELGGNQRSVRRSVSNFVRRRATSLSTRPKSWRRQSRHVDKGNVDQQPDSTIQLSKDDMPVAGSSSATATVEPPSIVVQPASQHDLQPPRPPSTLLESTPEQPEEAATTSSPVPDAIPPTPPSESPTSPSAAVPTDNRQFPPPGTLVVVQGVVHTTDGTGRPPEASSDFGSGPRRRALSVPRPSTADSDRRFSDLFTRPRPASAAPVASPIASTSSAAPVQPHSSSTHGSEDVAAATSDTHDVNSSQPTPTTSGSTGGPSLSSTSVDVLGTLLSVAAAATAASLLSGSSEPMQSSGLAPPRAAPSVPTLSSSPSGANRAFPRNDRVRNPWGSLRERFGRRNNPSAVPPSSEPSTVDARERMISEMARAFNLGLGLNNETFDTSSNSDSPSAPIAPSPPPAEGSFERFLFDLQADLRVALNEHDAAIEAAQSSTTPVTPEYVRPEMPDVPDDVTTTLSHSMEEEEDVPEREEEPEPSQPAQTPARLNWWRLYRFPSIPAPASRSNPSPTSPLQETPRNSSSTMATSGSTGSSDSSDNSDERTETSTSSTSPPASPNMVVPIIVVGLQSVNLNLNWPSPAPAPMPMPAAAPYIPTSHEQAASSTSVSADNGSHDPHSFTTPTVPSTPPLDETSSRLDQDPLPFFGQEAPSSTSDNVLEDFGASLPSAAPIPTPPASDNGTGGARTFLIYVIGGYYPPEHSMVTGEFANLDSFDALLDLAELLGQVKPPTVSQDDINRSGLEVIKSTQLAEWEKAGRISNNCVDRCLICLDDYAEEDDVRVMNCRHGFHKDCVDKWMQTGKNNCPACRSTGVSSTDPNAATPSTTAVN